MTTRTLWKCIACGCLAGQGKANGDDAGAPRRVFTRGALGLSPQVFTQRFIGGRGRGMEWERRPMNHEELAHVGRALARGLEIVAEALDDKVVAATPERVLSAIDDDAEAAFVGQQWIAEAAEEFVRRQRIVDADLQRRGS